MRWVRGGGAASQRTVNYSVFSLEGNTVDLIWNLNLISNVLLCYKNNNKVKQQNKAIKKKKITPMCTFCYDDTCKDIYTKGKNNTSVSLAADVFKKPAVLLFTYSLHVLYVSKEDCDLVSLALFTVTQILEERRWLISACRQFCCLLI